MHRILFLAGLLAVWLVAVLPVSAATSDGGAQESVLIFVEGEHRENLLANPDSGELVQELADAVVLRADDEGRSALRAAGYRVEVLPDPHQVLLRTGTIDVREVPLSRTLAPRGEEAVPLLVVFDGVPVAAWVEGLEAAGATVVGPIPPAAVLVTADEAALGRIQSLSGVLRVAPYLPQWKLDSRLQSGPARAPARLVTFPGSPVERVLELAADLGVALVGSEAFDRTVLQGILSAAEAAQLAELPAVERIEIVGRGSLYNDQMRVVMQTDKAHFAANQAFYNPVYWIGVWGASQTVTLADSGLNLPPLDHLQCGRAGELRNDPERYLFQRAGPWNGCRHDSARRQDRRHQRWLRVRQRLRWLVAAFQTEDAGHCGSQ